MIGARVMRSSLRTKRNVSCVGSKDESASKRRKVDGNSLKVTTTADKTDQKPTGIAGGLTGSFKPTHFYNTKLLQSGSLFPRKTTWRDDTKGHPEKLSLGDEQDDRPNLEKIRLKNLEDNAKFLKSLGLENVFKSLKPKPKPRIKLNQVKKEPVPRRKSLRLQNIPSGSVKKFQVETFSTIPEKVRLVGQLAFSDQLATDISIDEASEFISQLETFTGNYTRKGEGQQPLKSFQANLKKLMLREDQVKKVTPGRICSLAVHPTSEKVLVCAGDKYGNIGLCDMESSTVESVCYTPHISHVYQLAFHPEKPSQLLSASSDGILRTAHFDKAVFDELYVTPEDERIRLMSFDMLSPNTMLVSQDDGCIAVVDTRTKSSVAEKTYQIHQNTIKCVSVHPTQKHCFVSASNDSSVALWDLRNMTKKKPTSLFHFPHFRSVDSAYFSPVNGHRIVTSSLDDKLRIYDSSDLTQVHEKSSIRHDNNTGRWLSNFRATWHPQYDDLFVVGSMDRPRKIQVFDDNGRIVKVFQDEYLASVCSLNIFHPTRNVLVGGNSSGRIHVFME